MNNRVKSEKPPASVGSKIKKIRNMCGMTQKELGIAVGFDEKSADVRIAQYESGARTPKEKTTTAIANALSVNPKALARVDIDDFVGLAHTLFVLEDIYGLTIKTINGNLCIMPDKSKSGIYLALCDIFTAWQMKSEQFRKGEITEDEYFAWKYNFCI
jgi:transcriptional regulator with XRE-family HTH domain